MTAILCLGIVIIFARPNGTNQTIELNPREKVELVSNEARPQISARNSKSEPTQPPDPAPEETNPYRRAAREVIAAGGAVHITGLVPGSTNELQRITLTAGMALPDEPFFVNGVNVSGNPGWTDSGMPALRRLPELDFLAINGTAVTDADWEPFSKCLWLTRINLMNASLGDAGLGHLCKSGAVQDLTLHGLAKLTPAGLEPLTGMPRLVRLNLNHTRVGDAAVETLARCQHLRWLGLWETGITPAGVERLAKQLPHCAIHHNGGLVIPKPLPDEGP